MKEGINSLINVYKRLRETPRGRSILFFMLFFLFLIFVSLYLRVNNNNYVENNNTNNKNDIDSVDFSFLNNKYSLNIRLDNNNYIYSIDNINNTIIDEVNNKSYKKELDNYYILDNNNYISINNPIKFNRFIEVEYINNLLDISYLESNSTYKDNDYKSNNYLLDINNISKIMDGKISDFNSNSDYLKLYFNNINKVNRIYYDLDNYCRYNNICSYSLVIDINSI